MENIIVEFDWIFKETKMEIHFNKGFVVRKGKFSLKICGTRSMPSYTNVAQGCYKGRIQKRSFFRKKAVGGVGGQVS